MSHFGYVIIQDPFRIKCLRLNFWWKIVEPELEFVPYLARTGPLSSYKRIFRESYVGAILTRWPDSTETVLIVIVKRHPHDTL